MAIQRQEKARRNVLLGRFDHALDPKKRLMIPSEWRWELGSPEYIYVFPDPVQPCLDLVPKDTMDARIESLQERALFDPALNDSLQAISECAKQLAFDSAGRIRISDRLLAYAELDSTVAMVGAVRIARLWNPKRLGPADGVDVDKFKDAMSRLGFL